MNILHISGSPKGDRSDSGRLVSAFLQYYHQRCPDHQIRGVNVFDDEENPDFGSIHAFHKLAPLFQEAQTEEGHQAWIGTERIIENFDHADKIILSCPMWNYSVPWAMKRYLDHLMQPGRTFGFNKDTRQHIGLLRDRPVQFILTRSSTGTDNPADFQLPYLQYIFRALGLSDMRVISVCATTQASHAARQSYVESFLGEVRKAAANF